VTASVELAQIDFTDLDNFAGGFPHELFAVHRRRRGLLVGRHTCGNPCGVS